MYGYRARIGYTSAPAISEAFVHEFYRIAPAGVTLAINTGAIVDLTDEEIARGVEQSLEIAKVMARRKVDIIILGGIPLNLWVGYERIGKFLKDLEEEHGVPFSSSITCQMNALRQVRAEKLVVVQIADPSPVPEPKDDYLSIEGFEVLGVKGVGVGEDWLARTPSARSAALARQLMEEHPDADTVYIPSPNKATADQIEAIERDTGANVVTASQSIIWEGLRRCGVTEPIYGWGRLFRGPWEGLAFPA